MQHTITIGGLLSFLCLLTGIGLCAFGALVVFATGMSDNPSDADPKPGCLMLLFGGALIVGSVWPMLS